MTVLTSKDNPKVRHWRKLAEDPRYRRAQKRALIEGPRLLTAALPDCDRVKSAPNFVRRHFKT